MQWNCDRRKIRGKIEVKRGGIATWRDRYERSTKRGGRTLIRQIIAKFFELRQTRAKRPLAVGKLEESICAPAFSIGAQHKDHSLMFSLVDLHLLYTRKEWFFLLKYVKITYRSENNYAEPSWLLEHQNFARLSSCLSILHNYFDGLT